MTRRLHGRRAALGLFLIAAFAGGAVAPAADVSPFEKVGTGAAPASASDPQLDALQLSGISMIGPNQLFNLVDPNSHRSFWVPLNGTAEGYTVTAFDAASDSVVVQRGALSRTIQLRRAVITSTAAATDPPAPRAAPAIPQPPPTPIAHVNTPNSAEIVNPKTPQEIAQAEMEARMLVSDLLEISMRERARQRALREAQKNGQPPPK